MLPLITILLADNALAQAQPVSQSIFYRVDPSNSFGGDSIVDYTLTKAVATRLLLVQGKFSNFLHDISENAIASIAFLLFHQ